MPQTTQSNAYYSSISTTTQYIPMNWNNATTFSYQTNQSHYTPILTVSRSDQAWYQWVTMGTGTMTTSTSPNYVYREQTLRDIEATRERQEREAQERRIASVRARTLLEEFLSDEQKVELERQGRFHVTGSRGRRYCIRTSGQQGNVDLLKPDGQVQATLCAHPRGYLPDGDAWLAQMIELRHDEDHFLHTANVHRGSLPVAA
jgi:hypothetical protein